MTCPRCDRANADRRRYCGGCGASLEHTCGACDFVNRADDRFCGGCGDGLPELAHARVIAAPAPSGSELRISAADLRALLADIAPEVVPQHELTPGTGAVNQDDLDRLFGGAV